VNEIEAILLRLKRHAWDWGKIMRHSNIYNFPLCGVFLVRHWVYHRRKRFDRSH
jgi:hypothetical protein